MGFLPGDACPQLIVFTGISGSGKTTVAYDFGRPLNATIFSMDTALIERDKRPGPGFIEKWDLAMADRVLTSLLASEPAEYVGYRQESAKCDQWIQLLPRPLIIVEGVLPFWIPVVRKYAALTFWVEAPIHICEARQVTRWKRDGWYPGLPEHEVMKRIAIKRTEEVPLILTQHRLCKWTIENSVNHEL